MNAVPISRPSLLLRLRDLDDAEAWHEFVQLYTPLVFAHCIRHGLQEADAADDAQEVMRVVAQYGPAMTDDNREGTNPPVQPDI